MMGEVWGVNKAHTVIKKANPDRTALYLLSKGVKGHLLADIIRDGEVHISKLNQLLKGFERGRPKEATHGGSTPSQK